MVTMDVNASEQCYEELRSDYFIAVSDFLDLVDLEGFPNEAGGERKPWLVCLIPEAAQQLVLVGGVQSKFSLRTIDRVWRLAGAHYTEMELNALFLESIQGQSLDPIFSPAMRGTARTSMEEGDDEEPYTAVVALCTALYEVNVGQGERAIAELKLSSMGWGDFTQVLMRKLTADGHASDEDRELALARDLGL